MSGQRLSLCRHHRLKCRRLYEEIFLYDAEIIDGSGSDSYYEGDVVEITANDAPEGYRFKGWTVVSGDVELDDASSETTTFTMPAEDVQIKAEYEVVKYSLVVNNGSGSGSYAMGEQVSLTANYPSSGKVFAGWKVTGGNAGVASADRYYSSITMPAEDVTVEATYKDGPSPDYNEIQNITAGGEYLKGETITFTAAGNGMDNTNPESGRLSLPSDWLSDRNSYWQLEQCALYDIHGDQCSWTVYVDCELCEGCI